jgi:hypothetical protein
MIDDVATFDEVVGQALQPREVVPTAFSGAIAANAMSSSTSSVRMEVADLEHSEPGTGQPPEPRETGEVLGGTTRFELPEQPVPPPVTFEENTQGGRMNEELSTQLRTLLSLPDADEDTLLARVRELDTSNRALESATEAASKRYAFAEMFPEEAARMARLEDERLHNAAQSFSKGFEKARVQVGANQFGFSSLVLTSLEEAHLAFAKGEGNLETFENAVRTIVSEGGFVNYENTGSDRTDDSDDLVVTPGSQNARVVFAEKVAEVKNKALAEGRTISQGDAVAEAARLHPQLASAWAQTKSEA